MKRRPQMALVHMVSLTFLKKPDLQCRFQTTQRPTAPLGSRILTDPSRVFEHNMWDHIQWTPEQEDLARQKAEENSSVKLSMEEQVRFDKDANRYWDEFYKAHQNKFFKDRRWLFMEFPELLPQKTHKYNEIDLESKSTSILCSHVSLQTQTKLDGIIRMHATPFETPQIADSVERTRTNEGMKLDDKKQDQQWTDRLKDQGYFPGTDFTFKIFEVGCGAGNSVFPILSKICDTSTFLYCCDFSACAVDLVMSHPLYNASKCYAFVHDLCDEASSTYPFPDGSIDVILLVFVLSSIHPERMQMVINRLSKLLKPGGMILFRDYGRYDMSQLRFKKEGSRPETLTVLLPIDAAWPAVFYQHFVWLPEFPASADFLVFARTDSVIACLRPCRCLFGNFYVRGDGTRVYFFSKEEIAHIFISAGLKEVQNLMDRRLQVNRKKKIAMHRVWVQCKYQKPFTANLN
ncbi:mRNA N(3)-methylcytidine methyltransferase METTL8 isoform X3 [Hypanus sabinus]|nr:mRNA N(3)-methylcytidine methyltransferase METTL8 isoform X3 [Hypanus sabinus]XP_059822567.1 mRNA N(3)-methylcytidine methyltransferase METTL8 isoform X3 [Hypanus sabinus]XP_059822568.1 mRNA N(3)-methylcytidine methyltransferase METTL8 isoform X3 [Hypanus sabinus]XP_059822569.1 mRNA N(3)-methylcytidine methyltransferase METTL8 isoform X3 [Hypanus sabinus]